MSSARSRCVAVVRAVALGLLAVPCLLSARD
jgi:hypothetical protein